MPKTATRSRRVDVGTRNGIPRRTRDVRALNGKADVDGYDWGVDVAGEVRLGGVRFVLANRYAVRIRAPTRFT